MLEVGGGGGRKVERGRERERRRQPATTATHTHIHSPTQANTLPPFLSFSHTHTYTDAVLSNLSLHSTYTPAISTLFHSPSQHPPFLSHTQTLFSPSSSNLHSRYPLIHSLRYRGCNMVLVCVCVCLLLSLLTPLSLLSLLLLSSSLSIVNLHTCSPQFSDFCVVFG